MHLGSCLCVRERKRDISNVFYWFLNVSIYVFNEHRSKTTTLYKLNLKSGIKYTFSLGAVVCNILGLLSSWHIIRNIIRNINSKHLSWQASQLCMRQIQNWLTIETYESSWTHFSFSLHGNFMPPSLVQSCDLVDIAGCAWFYLVATSVLSTLCEE